ncbi:hypothetical protein GOP47_0011194, partial [Adiantum capillus-veneris]
MTLAGLIGVHLYLLDVVNVLGTSGGFALQTSCWLGFGGGDCGFDCFGRQNCLYVGR